MEIKPDKTWPRPLINKTMDKWIKELGENAKDKYSLYEDGDLFEQMNGAYSVVYKHGTCSVWICKTITIEQLEALTAHMKKYNKE